ncbi:MAG: nuclear transport factor 2 family protein [Terracidiphilus sp.]
MLHSSAARLLAANAEQNKELIFNFYDLFYNQKKFDEAGQYLDQQVVSRHAGKVGRGRRSMIENFSRDVREKFPNIRFEVSRMIASGDYVWTHGLATGLPGGSEALCVDIWKIEDGKLIEHWGVRQPVEPGQDVAQLL